MMAQSMQQQMEMQKQMMAALAALKKNSAPEVPTSPAFLTPVLPKEKKPAQPQQKVSPRRSPRLKKGSPPQVSPQRRSPRLVEKAKNEAQSRDGKTLKRTLSWSEAFKNAKRMKKPASVQKLRKRIGLKLGVLDEQLMRGDFHELSAKTKSGLKFNRDEFFDKVAPIVYDLTGGTQDDGDEELPGKCLEIARDIMRKKFQYQADQNAVVKSKKQQQKGTKNISIASKILMSDINIVFHAPTMFNIVLQHVVTAHIMVFARVVVIAYVMVFASVNV